MSQQRGQVATLPPAQQRTPKAASGSGKKAVVQTPVMPQPVSKQSRFKGWVSKLWQQSRQTLKGQFTSLAAGCLLLTLILALFVSQSMRRAADDLNTIAQGSIPSVDAAQAIAQYIDDIDAKAADYLATAPITEDEQCTSISGTNGTSMLSVPACDKITINEEIILANHQLFIAAHNVTYPGEQTAIERTIEGFEEYNGYLTVMFHEFDLAGGSTDPSNPHIKLAYQAYQHASAVLHQKIERQPAKDANGNFIFEANGVPSCTIDNPGAGSQVLQPQVWALGSMETALTCLSSINKAHLDQAYDDTTSFLSSMQIFLIVLCLLGFVLLAFTTWRMAVFTHRVINPGLTLALLTAFIFSIVLISFSAGLAGAHGAYGQMVNDDYNSVYYAAELKRFGTNANADESRWLIALEFNDQSDQSGADHWAADWQTNTAYVHYLISSAHHNRTWDEEDQPLADMDPNWNKYIDIDSQIRTTANTTADPQHLLKAEKLSTGDSNRAFGAFTDAVDALSKANYDHYNATLNATQGALATYIPLSAILFVVIGLLAVWGISRRLQDF